MLLTYWKTAIRDYVPFKVARENPEELRKKGHLDAQGFDYVMKLVSIVDRIGEIGTCTIDRGSGVLLKLSSQVSLQHLIQVSGPRTILCQASGSGDFWKHLGWKHLGFSLFFRAVVSLYNETVLIRPLFLLIATEQKENWTWTGSIGQVHMWQQVFSAIWYISMLYMTYGHRTHDTEYFPK